jgi:hypothetical protein
MPLIEDVGINKNLNIICAYLCWGQWVAQQAIFCSFDFRQVGGKVNMQEAHCNEYHTNNLLFIAKQLEVLKVIHDKIDHNEKTSPCHCALNQAYG